MSTHAWDARLHPPARRRTSVPRERLLDRVGRLDRAAVTLIAAPAGFGKSTLLADWAARATAEARAVAWLSLAESDSDPAAFAASLVAACAAADPRLGEEARGLAGSGAPVGAVIASLVGDLAAVEGGVVVVLDDYHLVHAMDVHEAIAAAVESLPATAHLVISTRADPPLPLARWRARGELAELRAADLRFTSQEAAAFLRDTMSLTVDDAEVAALERRTEGWVAALQLAAVSLDGRDDRAAFLASFAGDDRHVVDYLVEEVLLRQPAEVRDFLLRTSILDRLGGELCDAVTRTAGGAAMLERLERANLFLIPLDDRREWYRYHHLFADMLRARLLDEDPEGVAALHARASEWWEAGGDSDRAIVHALAAGDDARAAGLVEVALPGLRRSRREDTMLRWLESLPAAELHRRPVLGIGLAGARLVRGDVTGVPELLAEVEGAVDGPESSRVVSDEAAFAGVPATISMYRAALALMAGDADAAERHARRCAELAAPDDHLSQGAAAALMGLVLWRRSELDSAVRSYGDAIAALTRAGHVADVRGCTLALADMETARGRLGEAARLLEERVREASGPGSAGTVIRGVADMHVALSEIMVERGRVDEARVALDTAAALGETTGLAQMPSRMRVVRARIAAVEGDGARARELLDAAAAVHSTDFSPDVRPIAAVRARVELAAGDVGAALRWARDAGIDASDPTDYLREFEHVTLARVLIAAGAAAEAAGLLARLGEAAEAGGRLGSLVEIRAVEALALAATGDRDRALAALAQALELGAAQDRVRVFLDLGEPLARLLPQVEGKVDGAAAAHARRLLALGAVPTPAPGRAPAQPGGAPALSARELEVLGLLATDLSGPEIARRLFVSLNTFNTHTRAIYTKLDVSGRRAAVTRARDAGLL